MECLTLARDINIIRNNTQTHEESLFASRIEVIGEKTIFISQPFKKDCYGQSLQAEVGEVISICVPAESCFYLFEAKIVSINTDPPEFWELSLSTNLKRKQRRQHVRIPIILDVTIKFFDIKMKVINAFTKDISAGGLQVVLEELPPSVGNSDVKVVLPLIKEATMELKGEILRVTTPETLRKRFTMAIKFNDITEETQEEMIKYIFHKQVERRQKEKEIFGKKFRISN